MASIFDFGAQTQPETRSETQTQTRSDGMIQEKERERERELNWLVHSNSNSGSNSRIRIESGTSIPSGVLCAGEMRICDVYMSRFLLRFFSFASLLSPQTVENPRRKLAGVAQLSFRLTADFGFHVFLSGVSDFS